MPETPVFATAAVAAPHRLAAETGLMVLAAGGNAVEAMVAMAATAAVVAPRLNGPGGDGFWLVREPKGRVHALDASGPAGTLATMRRYWDKGYDAIPVHGPEAALTVAGAVGGWALALELAKALGGKMPLDLLLGDAIRFARDGYPISIMEGRVLADAPDLFTVPGFAAVFLEEKKLPPAGTTRRNLKLADALGHLAHAGLGDFYRGDVGREIAADLERIGSPILRSDLENYRPRVVEPLSLRLKHSTVYSVPPPSQGLASLLTLGIFEWLHVRRGETPEHHHGLIEAAKRAFAIRDRVITDPREVEHDLKALLAPDALEREAVRIDGRRAADLSGVVDSGEGVWMGCIDKDGLAVSYSQSLFSAFGSGSILPTTGIHWHNRGTAFSLDPKSRNPLEPGRKPFHTLNPGLAAFDDGRVLAYGSGEGEPQVLSQIFSRYAVSGMGLTDAVDAPRSLFTKGTDGPMLKLEDRFDPSLIRDLSRLGHSVEELGKRYADAHGHAGMVVKHPRNGRVEASHDPRADGEVLGL
ncbi:gamma-glutamyltransferase family protein [Microvirga terricola]|uniref:Gamma-glutamyltransferase n=1 Tax=Microvirga terricola TaxID=2719797 RepID=A0ABX0VG66_9HYPH|nr:gamma-glutamyltransferase [Microvirga terricola]NIX77990.1 gamma-glutamyltransferase [Microvirga terricola]